MTPIVKSSLQRCVQIPVRFVAACAAVALVGSMVAGCSDGQDSNNADGGSIVPKLLRGQTTISVM